MENNAGHDLPQTHFSSSLPPECNFTMQQWLYRRTQRTKRYKRNYIILHNDRLYSFRKAPAFNKCDGKNLSSVLRGPCSSWAVLGADIIVDPEVIGGLYKWRIVLKSNKQPDEDSCSLFKEILSNFPRENKLNLSYCGGINRAFHTITSSTPISVHNATEDAESTIWLATKNYKVATDWLVALLQTARYGSLFNFVHQNQLRKKYQHFSLPWYLLPFEFYPKDCGYREKHSRCGSFTYMKMSILRLMSISMFEDSSVYCAVEFNSSFYIIQLSNYEERRETEIKKMDSSLSNLDDAQATVDTKPREGSMDCKKPKDAGSDSAQCASLNSDSVNKNFEEYGDISTKLTCDALDLIDDSEGPLASVNNHFLPHKTHKYYSKTVGGCNPDLLPRRTNNNGELAASAVLGVVDRADGDSAFLPNTGKTARQKETSPAGQTQASGTVFSRLLNLNHKAIERKKSLVERTVTYKDACIYIPIYKNTSQELVWIHFFIDTCTYVGSAAISDCDFSLSDPAPVKTCMLKLVDSVNPLNRRRLDLSDHSKESTVLGKFNSKSVINRTGMVMLTVVTPKPLGKFFDPVAPSYDSPQEYLSNATKVSTAGAIQMLVSNIKRVRISYKTVENFVRSLKGIFEFRNVFASFFVIFYIIFTFLVFPEKFLIFVLLPMFVYTMTLHPSFMQGVNSFLLRYPILILILPKAVTRAFLTLPRSVCAICAKKKWFLAVNAHPADDSVDNSKTVLITRTLEDANNKAKSSTSMPFSGSKRFKNVSIYTKNVPLLTPKYILNDFVTYTDYEENMMEFCNHRGILQSYLSCLFLMSFGGSGLFNGIQGDTSSVVKMFHNAFYCLPPYPLGVVPFFHNVVYTFRCYMAAILLTMAGGIGDLQILHLLHRVRALCGISMESLVPCANDGSAAPVKSTTMFGQKKPRQIRTFECYENERRAVFGNFSKDNLRFYDPPCFSSENGTEVNISKIFRHGARLIITPESDKNGWMYSKSWNSTWVRECTPLSFVRRRKWVVTPQDQSPLSTEFILCKRVASACKVDKKYNVKRSTYRYVHSNICSVNYDYFTQTAPHVDEDGVGPASSCPDKGIVLKDDEVRCGEAFTKMQTTNMLNDKKCQKRYDPKVSKEGNHDTFDETSQILGVKNRSNANTFAGKLQSFYRDNKLAITRSKNDNDEESSNLEQQNVNGLKNCLEDDLKPKRRSLGMKTCFDFPPKFSKGSHAADQHSYDRDLSPPDNCTYSRDDCACDSKGGSQEITNKDSSNPATSSLRQRLLQKIRNRKESFMSIGKRRHSKEYGWKQGFFSRVIANLSGNPQCSPDIRDLDNPPDEYEQKVPPLVKDSEADKEIGSLLVEGISVDKTSPDNIGEVKSEETSDCGPKVQEYDMCSDSNEPSSNLNCDYSADNVPVLSDLAKYDDDDDEALSDSWSTDSDVQSVADSNSNLFHTVLSVCIVLPVCLLLDLVRAIFHMFWEFIKLILLLPSGTPTADDPDHYMSDQYTIYDSKDRERLPLENGRVVDRGIDAVKYKLNPLVSSVGACVTCRLVLRLKVYVYKLKRRRCCFFSGGHLRISYGIPIWRIRYKSAKRRRLRRFSHGRSPFFQKPKDFCSVNNFLETENESYASDPGYISSERYRSATARSAHSRISYVDENFDGPDLDKIKNVVLLNEYEVKCNEDNEEEVSQSEEDDDDSTESDSEELITPRTFEDSIPHSNQLTSGSGCLTEFEEKGAADMVPSGSGKNEAPRRTTLYSYFKRIYRRKTKKSLEFGIDTNLQDSQMGIADVDNHSDYETNSNTDVETEHKLSVIGMLRKVKDQIISANYKIHLYTVRYEKFLNMFSWKNYNVTLIIAVFFIVLILGNFIVKVQTLILIYLLLQFKSGYVSGTWERNILHTVKRHIDKCLTELEIYRPFWDISNRKTASLAKKIRSFSGVEVPLSVIRESTDEWDLARKLTEQLVSSKLYKAWKRQNWLVNLFLRSPCGLGY